MSLDERLFGWLYRSLRRRGAGDDDPGEGAARLDALHGRLEFLASALAGEAIIVRTSEAMGGFRRGSLLLPEYIDLSDAHEMNQAAYVYRVAYSISSRSLGFTTEGFPEFEGAPIVGALLAAPSTRAHLADELPTSPLLLDALLEAMREELPPLAPGGSSALALIRLALGGDVIIPPSEGILASFGAHPPSDASALAVMMQEHHDELVGLASELTALASPILPLVGRLFAAAASMGAAEAPDESKGTPPEAGASEQKAPRRDELEVVELGKSDENENPFVHSFEKVHTLDDYKGGSKRHDGEDELDEQMAALDELDLRQVVRTSETAQAVLKLDGLFEGFAGEVADSEGAGPGRPHVCYDEWDESKRRYRPNWCTLYLEPPRRTSNGESARKRVQAVRREHARQLQEMRATLEALEMERRWRNRQMDGTEVDIEALVDRRAALAAGRTPDDRVYASRRRHERELATLVLLDLSLSSDSYIDDRRILDVARDAIIVLGEVLHDSNDHFAVAGFQSRTRQECRWLPMKNFDDPWPLAVERMLAVEPAGYTRIGPALRHGIRVLAEHPARRRLLLLVTDAKPTDYDRYEGRYGMDDVRQAFREAEGLEVHPFAVTIAENTGSTLPRMFGAGRYEVLKRPDDLPAALTEVYTRLAR